MTAVDAGTAPEGVDGSHEMDYAARQVVILVSSNDEAVETALTALLGEHGWRTKFVGAPRHTDEPDPQHFVGAYFSTAAVGDDVDSLAELDLELSDVVERAGVGDVDGLCDEGDEQAIFAYGPDADELLAVMRPALERFPIRPTRVVLRYGEADDPGANVRELVL
jgi:hypothetical protein